MFTNLNKKTYKDVNAMLITELFFILFKFEFCLDSFCEQRFNEEKKIARKLSSYFDLIKYLGYYFSYNLLSYNFHIHCKNIADRFVAKVIEKFARSVTHIICSTVDRNNSTKSIFHMCCFKLNRLRNSFYS
jgi:hypothetical protein